MIEPVVIQRITKEVQQVVAEIEAFTGLKSRWNGEVHVVDPTESDLLVRQSFLAKKEWRCSILVTDRIANSDLRWRSLIHEALHSVSAGMTEQDYTAFRGWEEGVVEALQREYRPGILRRLNLSIGEEIFTRWEAAWVYQDYIIALERIAAEFPNVTRISFLEALLKTPLKDRMAYTLAWGLRELPDRERFRHIFAEASGVLRG